MKQQAKKMLAVLLAALLMLGVFAACGNGGNSSTAPETSSKQDSQPVSEPNSEPASSAANEPAGDTGLTYDGDEATVTYWHTHSDQEEAVLKDQIIPEFEKQFPKIHIKPVRMPYDGLKQQVIQGVSSGTAPELMRLDIIWVPEFAKMGALVAVDDLPGFAEMKDTLFEGPLGTNYYDGKYYGLPLNTNCLSGVWSKSMLEQLGFSEPPATYDEMLAVKDQLKDGQYLMSADGANSWGLAPLFYSLGGRWTNEDYTKASGYMNGEASVKALETIVQWFDEGILGPATLGGKPDVANGAFKGQYLLTYQGPWFFTGNKEEDLATVENAVLPAGDGGSASVVGGEDLVMFNSSKNQEAAWVFARFLMSDFAQRAQAVGGGHLIPTVKDVANSDEVMATENMEAYVKQLEDAIPRTPHPAWEKMSDKISKVFESCLRHEAEPKAALDKMAAEVDVLLEEEK